MRKILLVLVLLAVILSGISGKGAEAYDAKSCTVMAAITEKSDTAGIPEAVHSDNVVDKIGDILFGGEAEVSAKVYLGGIPLGLSLNSRGVKVIGLSEIMTSQGLRAPAVEADIRIGDVILQVEGENITSAKTLSEAANKSGGKSIVIRLMRKGEVIKVSAIPALDITDGKYKLGLWAKEGSSGIGTLTYVENSGKFGSLGHPIVNPENGEIYSITGGRVYDAVISGVVKGVRGRAGELRGSFNDKVIGSISVNNKYGVYGELDESVYKYLPIVEVEKASKVKPGKAQIYSTINGSTPEVYDIEIIKAAAQNKADDKGMVIRVTDERLISQTGGIVQGMSGSPIVQNGKLIGAVTHVFVNDPLKGYGVYAEWMLINSSESENRLKTAA